MPRTASFHDFHVDFAMTVRGNSMSPEIMHGDLVFFQNGKPDDGGIAAVCINGDYTIKHVHYLSNGIKLVSNSDLYPPMIFSGSDLQDITIIGVFAGLIRLIQGPTH